MKPIIRILPCTRTCGIATIAVLLAGSIVIEASVTGQWDFTAGNLDATVGQPLSYFDPGGPTEAATRFGMTTDLGLPDIGGELARVMGFPKCDPMMGYIMPHGVPPSGEYGLGETYTLIFDLLYPPDSHNKWRALIQIDDVDFAPNSTDAELFINPANGIGIAGNYSGQIYANTWHRVGFVKDGAALHKYIDGFKVGQQTLAGGGIRWALSPGPWGTALLFTDDNNETEAGYVASIQVRDVALASGEMAALGGPSAGGIPFQIPTLLSVTISPSEETGIAGMAGMYFRTSAAGREPFSYQWYRGGESLPGQTGPELRIDNLQLSDAGAYTVMVTNPDGVVTSEPATLAVAAAPRTSITGQWDFNRGDLSATFGQAMDYYDTQVAADTSFGSTTAFGIANIAGQPANVMYCNPMGGQWGGYIMHHGIAPNGGGEYVNQYTLIMDVLYPSTSGGYRSLWQTDINNSNDGDLFVHPNGGIGISGVYQGEVRHDAWHRLVFAFDLTRGEVGKYIDGINVLENRVGSSPQGPHIAQYLGSGVDGRWSLGPAALLLADEDGEVAPVYVSSVQIRGGRMTDEAVAALGGPTAHKIPGHVRATVSGPDIIIEWAGALLESAADLDGPWTTVSGAAQPYTVPQPLDATRFFRSRQ